MQRVEPEDLRRRQPIEATIDTMAAEGFAATTLALSAQKAGVSPGLIARDEAGRDTGLLANEGERGGGEALGGHRVDGGFDKLPATKILGLDPLHVATKRSIERSINGQKPRKTQAVGGQIVLSGAEKPTKVFAN